MKLTVRILPLLVLLLPMPGLAHHSFPAEYDADQHITLNGTVTRVEWTNPHIFIYIDVPDEQSGEMKQWTLELGAPNALLRLGWKRDSLKAGDDVKVEGSLARNGKPLVNADSITMADSGRTMLAGSSRNRQ